MLTLPIPPGTANERQLAQMSRERITGLTTTALTLVDPAVEGYELVFKNGVLLDPNGGTSGYAISGASITLGAAAIAADVFVVFYWFRGTA
jgi:Ethanolamine utilization protein EutJ (predicted chaperonin)